jgi:nucleoside phosphorylase
VRSPTRNHRCAPLPVLAALLLACVVGAPDGADARKPRVPICDAVRSEAVDAPSIVILGAFPAELRALVAATQIESTITIEGRSYYTGRLAGARVVLGLTGIGLVNADLRTRAVLANVRAAAVLMNGVAGSPRRIGEVLIPEDWVFADGAENFPVNEALAAIAERAKAVLPRPLEQCTPVPPESPTAEIRCLSFVPDVILGGHGQSDDPYGGVAFPCLPGGGSIVGCELPALAAVSAPGTTQPDIVDMETTAVARAAASEGVPFLAMRAVSDGDGDPLGFRGFPAQFFDYYQLAADNAGLVTQTVVAQIAEIAADRRGRKACKLLAHRQWRKAAKRIRSL